MAPLCRYHIPFRHFSLPQFQIIHVHLFQILASLLTNHFLHREIREKGGAYGGGARYSAADGTFSLYSYRDPPGLARTLETFSKAEGWAGSVKEFVGLRVRLLIHFVEEIERCHSLIENLQELEEAKLSVFQNIDAPISAANEVW